MLSLLILEFILALEYFRYFSNGCNNDVNFPPKICDDIKLFDHKLTNAENELLDTYSHIKFAEDKLSALKLKVEEISADTNDWKLNVALQIAAESSDIGVVRALIKRGAKINHTDENDTSILTKAISYNNFPVVHELLDQGADPHHKNNNGWSAFIAAAGAGNLQAVLALLSYGVDLHQQYENGGTALMFAAAKGHLDIVRELLDRDQKQIDHQKIDGVTALLWAATAGQTVVVSKLLDCGANPNHQDIDHFTALDHVLFRRGRTLATQNNQTNASSGDIFPPITIAHDLLEHGADPNRILHNGWTLLPHAIRNLDVEMVTALLKYGANPNHVNSNGKIPLHFAIDVESPEIIEVLLEHDIDIEFINKDGPAYHRHSAGY